MKYFRITVCFLILLFATQNLFAQSLVIPTSELNSKIVALIDLHEHGQLLVSQKDNSEQFTILLIDNNLKMKWEAEYPFEDGNGKKNPNYFTFLHSSTTIFITNQNLQNYFGEIDIETGDIKYEKVIEGSSELRKGEFYVSNENLIQANTEGNILRLQKIRGNSLITIAEILPPSYEEAVKKTSLKIIKISHDTLFAYQSLPEPNHRNLNIILYKFKTNGHLIDSTHTKLSLKKNTFGFNSNTDLDCQFVFENKNRIYMFGNLAPKLPDDFGQFPSSDDSYGIWWASFDDGMRLKSFNPYHFGTIFQQEEEMIFSQPKYWGVKADGDSGFFVNMNLLPGRIYSGNMTFYINSRGKLEMFTNADNKNNIMRYNQIFTRNYIKGSDVSVVNDDWNFYSTHHFSRLKYYPAFHSQYTKTIIEKANRYPENSQKSELAYSILYKEGYAILVEFYNKGKKEVKFEIVR